MSAVITPIWDRVSTPQPQIIARFSTHLRARRLSPGTIRQRAYYVARLALHVDLLTVDAETLEAELASYDNRAPETMKSVRSSWQAFYRWAHRTGLIDHDPSIDLAPIRIPITVPHVAPDDDIAIAISRASLRDRAMLQLARFACLRLTELTTLRIADRHGQWLHVTGKGSKQRRIYLTPELAHTLTRIEREQRGADYYFPGASSGHLHPQSVHKIIVRACGHNPHSLRHAGATAAYRSTRDLRAVQLMLGHASMAITQRYLHADDDALQAAALGTALAA